MNKTGYILSYVGWGSLGFIRGINSYTYQYKKERFESYLYLNSFGYGWCGIVFYMNPFLFPLFFYKELYRLEVDLRRLEDEKNKDYYNQLF
jgi:hypothetical protein